MFRSCCLTFKTRAVASRPIAEAACTTADGMGEGGSGGRFAGSSSAMTLVKLSPGGGVGRAAVRRDVLRAYVARTRSSWSSEDTEVASSFKLSHWVSGTNGPTVAKPTHEGI